ncbi:response regulator, partial [bacterium]|nr:response regulator [bacterium]
MGNKRILVVDYDPKSLSHTRDILQTAGFEVVICSDGLSALDHFRTMNPDLVLLSAMLPKMHGFEVCSNIRKIPGGEKTPVVIITDVYKGKRYRLDAINKYGATEYIEKPIADSNLVSILQNLIRGNGTPAQVAAPVSEDVDQTTVRFSPEDIKQAIVSTEKVVTEKPMPGAPAPKKPEKHRTRDDDDIDKKLEESLAGLSLDFSRGALAKLKSKSKPAPSAKPADLPGGTPQTLRPDSPIVPQKQLPASSAVAASVAGSSTTAPPEDSSFTSEDLFNDVIASVERELEYEKIITSSGVKQKTGAITNPVPAVAAESSKRQPSPKQAPVSSFDQELERKITSTLSGILKDKTKAEPATAKPRPSEGPSARMVEEPPQPTMQLLRETIESAMSAATTTATEGINFGQYLLLSKIATGGMAELFKAKRKGVEGFEKILAIKRILPHMSDNEEFITMFIDEAKLAARLTHHNVCQIFDLGKIDNSYYIAMEYVHGKDLRAVLRAARTRVKEIPVEL